MKQILSIILILVNVSFLSAQSFQISGQLIDKDNNESIPYASVKLLDANQEIVNFTSSDFEGNFEMNKVKKGEYDIEISFVGYHSLNKSISLSDHLNLGTVYLNPNVQQLDEIVVKDLKETVSTKIDRKVYDASDFETARSGTATDMLNKLPQISVSPEGDVSVRGTQGFMVYVNGKPTQIDPSTLLSQISAGSIENIEVITVPSAKYDAQGKAGIINITVNKSELEGTSISAGGMLGGSPWRDGAEPVRGGGNFNITHQKDKWTFNAGANYLSRNVDGRREGDSEITQRDSDGNRTGTYHMDAEGDRPEWHVNYSANAGVGYDFNENTSLKASYFYGHKSNKRTANYVYHNYYKDLDGQMIDGSEEYIYNPNTHNRFGDFHTANLDFFHQFENKSKLNLGVVYEHSILGDDLDNKNQVYNKGTESPEETILTHYTQVTDQPLHAIRFSLDYEKPISDNQTVSFGVQPQFLTQTGNYNYDTLNLNNGSWEQHPYSNSYELKRNIYAGYVDYGARFGKLNLKAGLRLEYTDQVMTVGNYAVFPIIDVPEQDEFVVQQLNAFPSLNLDYEFNENNRLIFGASRRINRPPTKNMAPFLYRRHFEVYEVGDPTLQPEFVNLAEVTFDKKIGNQNISLTAFYRGVENAVFRVNVVNEGENVLMRSYTNAGDDQSLGLELNSNFNIAKRVKLFMGGSLYHYAINGSIYGQTIDQSSLNWSWKSTLNTELTKTLSFVFDIDVQSATVTAQGQNDLFYMSNIALVYKPTSMPDWTFTGRANDIFQSNIKGLDTTGKDRNSNENTFYQRTTYYRYGPIVEFSVNYTMNAKPKKKGKKTEFDKQF
ncbi:TonB-dependent receptor domain-containing protein [Flammeovirga aprica]|uniref:TonB-dependent receptor n=1 Tax=Flammeovirga aprica JL-4 TaxID=694437 RepID=A0A7X9RZF0_9BACT|nr:TonB-dependent receptor [Flammeovirga aprica]NME71510.1 TonB-dependent receptor [Flammeovirga aprica JL-4]